MSASDLAFVQATGHSVARIASILAKSRQAVGRGIKKTDNYFGPHELISIIKHFETRGNPIAGSLREQTKRYYPEICELVLLALDSRLTTEDLPLDAGGEYWMVCGDFTSFRIEFPACYSTLRSIADRGRGHLVLFVNAMDYKSALKALRRNQSTNSQVVGCDGDVLRLAPAMLLHQSENGNVSLHVAGDQGFVHVSDKEAERIKYFIADHLAPDGVPYAA